MPLWHRAKGHRQEPLPCYTGPSPPEGSREATSPAGVEFTPSPTGLGTAMLYVNGPPCHEGTPANCTTFAEAVAAPLGVGLPLEAALKGTRAALGS